MSEKKIVPHIYSSSEEISAFVDRAKRGYKRLIFALDATASRQPTWDRACHLQAEMFQVTKTLGQLDVQLVFYRGFGECKASLWYSETHMLLEKMKTVVCLGGLTQITRVLKHTLAQTKNTKIDGLVFIGDCVEEAAEVLCDLSGKLGVLRVPIFIFQEGHNSFAESCFQQMARLSGGEHCIFDSNSPEQLRRLLGAVAAYVVGGHKALQNYSSYDIFPALTWKKTS